MHKPQFTNQVALVTGGGSGIGRATASAFASSGARVVVTGRNLVSCIETVDQIRDEGGFALAMACDVTCEAEVAALIGQVENQLGPIEIAFLNAGIGTSALITEQSLEEFESVMRTNCVGLMLCMKHLLRSMYERGRGTIVNNLSVHAYRTILEGTSAYTASKHAALALTKAAAVEAGAYGVRVNAVAPGPISTEMLVRSTEVSGGIGVWAQRIPIKRVGRSEEVANAVLWLSSSNASFINGAVINVDGGFLAC